MYGKKHTAETKAAMSAKEKQGKQVSSEVRAKISASLARKVYVFDAASAELITVYPRFCWAANRERTKYWFRYS